MQDNNMLPEEPHCECVCGERKTVEMQILLHELEEIEHVISIKCTPGALSRLRFIITKHGGTLWRYGLI